MKKDDPYRLNRKAWLEEAFDAAKDARKARIDRTQYRHEKIQELKQLKINDYERKQANEKNAQEIQANERRSLEERLKKAEEELNSYKSRTHAQ